MVFRDDVGGDVEIEVVVRKGEAEAARLTFAARDGGKTGEFGDEELIIINERASLSYNRAYFCPLEVSERACEVALASETIVIKVSETLGRNWVKFEARRPFYDDEETVGPAEALPDGFWWRKGQGVEHFEDHLRVTLRRGIFL